MNYVDNVHISNPWLCPALWTFTRRKHDRLSGLNRAGFRHAADLITSRV